jgi:thiol-disulfide isomerase/thioredoxin
LLDFWGIGCGPCVGEIPYLKKAYSQYKAKGFEIIGIGIDDPQELKQYTKEKDLNWIHICDTGKDIQKLYQVSGVPSLFLLNTDGLIIAKGSELRKEELINSLEKYVK